VDSERAIGEQSKCKSPHFVVEPRRLLASLDFLCRIGRRQAKHELPVHVLWNNRVRPVWNNRVRPV